MIRRIDPLSSSPPLFEVGSRSHSCAVCCPRHAGPTVPGVRSAHTATARTHQPVRPRELLPLRWLPLYLDHGESGTEVVSDIPPATPTPLPPLKAKLS